MNIQKSSEIEPSGLESITWTIMLRILLTIAKKNKLMIGTVSRTKQF